MSIFSSIASAIFGSSAHAESVPKTTGTPPVGGSTTVASAELPVAASPSSIPATVASPSAAAQSVDVAAVLDTLLESSDEDLDWRKSIVDLMKLLKLDSSLTARKTLAKELHFTGDMGDSAAMNVWLHKQVMTKLAENGGIVPPGLGH